MAPHAIRIAGHEIDTPRLTIKPWQLGDAADALEIYGADEVTRWLTPSIDRIADESGMRGQLRAWIEDEAEAPRGHWAARETDSGSLIGAGQIVPLPPERRDLLIGFEVLPRRWGAGFGAEIGHALAHYAFEHGIDEIFAVSRPRNLRARSTADRIGMEWVGETEKYFGLRLDVFRLRPGDLDWPRFGIGSGPQTSV